MIPSFSFAFNETHAHTSAPRLDAGCACVCVSERRDASSLRTVRWIGKEECLFSITFLLPFLLFWAESRGSPHLLHSFSLSSLAIFFPFLLLSPRIVSFRFISICSTFHFCSIVLSSRPKQLSLLFFSLFSHSSFFFPFCSLFSGSLVRDFFPSSSLILFISWRLQTNEQG